jgi:hypothetical protein
MFEVKADEDRMRETTEGECLQVAFSFFAVEKTLGCAQVASGGQGGK